ncbi:MAG: acyl-CoA thioesterase [Anaerolineae bacterium]
MTSQSCTEITFPVRYAETDAMGIVYHSNYIIWFEVGRGDYMRQRGWEYADLEARGYYLPVSELEARFLAPARYGDLVTVKTWLEELRSRKITFAYEVVKDGTGEVLAVGHTKHICTDKMSHVRSIPKEVREMLRMEVS